jgi:hypothetical protein
MPPRRKVPDNTTPRRAPGPPAMTPEEREQQLTALAYDLVEQRLLDGTATSQETTFFLKLGGERERLEKEKLRNENLLLEARKEQIGKGDRMEELLERAVRAFKGYSGEELPPEGEEGFYA